IVQILESCCYVIVVIVIVFFFFFFFFQAEDGIRDKLVTGVQTCALPISWCRGAIFVTQTPLCGTNIAPRHQAAAQGVPPVRHPRSEERRVGKECRSRWSPDD